jgi:hypothetical protein
VIAHFRLGKRDEARRWLNRFQNGSATWTRIGSAA